MAQNYPALTALLSGQYPALIKKVYVKNTTELWQTLGQISDGELSLELSTTDNTRKLNLTTNSVIFNAKFKIMQTAVLEVEALPALLGGQSGVANDWLFELADAVSLTGDDTASAGWVYVTADQVGAKGRFVSDGLPSTNQYMEIEISGSIYASSGNITAMLTPTLNTDDFHISATGDTGFAKLNNSLFGDYTLCVSEATYDYATGILTNIRPNGFRSVALDNILNPADDQSLTRIRNGKLTIDFLAEQDSLNRFNPNGVDVTIEYEYLITSNANLLKLDDINVLNTSIVVTLFDGKTFTFSSGLGFQSSFENKGDFDKLRIMKFMHKGRLVMSEDCLDAIVA
jgi:hypothetical protein